MPSTCPDCGRPLSEHDRHIRFSLPDPILKRGIEVGSDGYWLSHDTPRESVMLEVQGIGSFVRALLPVNLSGGYTMTFGVWVAVPSQEMRRAFETWWSPTYADLRIDGLLANEIQPWNVFRAEVRIEVRDVDKTPYIVSSSNSALSAVLTETWDHASVLAAWQATFD